MWLKWLMWAFWITPSIVLHCSYRNELYIIKKNYLYFIMDNTFLWSLYLMVHVIYHFFVAF